MLCSARRMVWLVLPLLNRAACQPGAYYQAGQTPLGAVDNGTVANCHQACLQLRELGHAGLLTYYPDLPGDSGSRFFTSQQNEMRPVCVVQPQSAEAVSLVVNSVRENRCSFAVRSGGHSINPGSSNVNDGLLLDLELLNQIRVSSDKKAVSLGPGNRWGAVYAELEKQGLLVVGGRASSVGVGGFTLGGGMSYLSRRYGWAIDNVLNYEVVLPNGTVAETSPDLHPDLYFALRGGNCNFGVVTRLDFEAHPYDMLWGGTSVYFLRDLPARQAALGLQDTFIWTLHSATVIAVSWLQSLTFKFGFGIQSHDLITTFVNLAKKEQEDAAAHAMIFLSFAPVMRAYVAGTTFFYSQPVERPEVFRNFTSFSPLFTTARLGRMSDFTNETDTYQPATTVRHIWRTSTFKVDGELISKLWDVFIAETHPVRLIMPEAVLSCNLQPLASDEIAQFSRNGGNAFGIDAQDGPLFIFSITVSYESSKNDELVKNLTDTVISKAVELGKQMKKHHPFIYPNYAAAGQDVFAGFSPATRQRLSEIRDVYDPGHAYGQLLPAHLQL